MPAQPPRPRAETIDETRVATQRVLGAATKVMRATRRCVSHSLHALVESRETLARVTRSARKADGTPL